MSRFREPEDESNLENSIMTLAIETNKPIHLMKFENKRTDRIERTNWDSRKKINWKTLQTKPDYVDCIYLTFSL